MKGGDAEYRRGPHAKAAFGRVAPGSWITEKEMGEYGSGASVVRISRDARFLEIIPAGEKKEKW